MSIFHSILYGIIQGLAEFLPISSSGHLAIVHSLLGDNGQENIAFDVLLHLGTLVAVCLVYRKDIGNLILSFFRLCSDLFHGKHKLSQFDEGERFVIFVLLATLPLIPAAILDHYIEVLSGYLVVVGIILLLNAILLFLSDRFSTGSKGLEEMTGKDALIVGLSQMIAVLPGLSRSGTTITVGLTRGFDRSFAVRFSFILSIPAILGACVLKLPDFFQEAAAQGSKQLLIYLCGALTAALVGIASMKFLQLLAKRAGFRFFSLYCAVVGLFAILWYFVA
jgi:undecaprenyl-diphosphatase